MSYDNWTKRLAGEEVKTFLQPGVDDEGYYRKPLTEMVLGKDGKTNGQRRVTGWIPVAYFLASSAGDDASLVGVIGAGEDLRNMTADEVTDESLWSWVCRNPIHYRVYQAVAEDGEPWPDQPKSKPYITLQGALNTSLSNGDFAAPTDLTDWSRQPDTGSIATDNTPPREKTREDYKSEIEAACASAPTKIESKEDAEEALGIKNRIGELRLEADKVGKAVYQPLHAAYAKAQKAWSGMVTFAKGHEDQIDKIVRIWREKERQRIMVEEARIAREAAEEADRLARAADRAIARGEPEPEPEVTEPVAPPVAEPLKPVYGRASAGKQEMKTFVTITDWDAVTAYFRGNPELIAVLQNLAERAVKSGDDVPGTTKRQGYA